ncbi:unnamed protein product [Rotaria magnacalcarata]|uniref:Maltase n=3 Tax=Rotaria magnacalcarata TaxID=392030 RepID=A0A815SXF2_9BILA|nr:unnamed protein product [Rotaria magnacalcarata]
MRILALIAVLVGLAIQLNVEVEGLAIEKSRSPMSSWQSSSIRTVELPNFMKVDPKYRVDCNPDIDEYRSFCVLNLSKNSTLTTSDESCTSRGCTRDTNVESGIPTCYIPTEKGGYSVTDGPTQLSSAMTQYTLTRLSTKPAHFRSSFINPSSAARATQFSMFGHDIENLKVQVSVSGPQMIRMTIRNADSQRYEVPVPIRWNPSAPTTSGPAKIEFEMTKTTNQQVGFRVKRTDSGSILFDTTLFANGFIYDDQFLQIITTIPSRNAYGFGENTHPSFRHELNKSNRYGIFARDQPPQGFNENLYGTHPFYMVIEPNGEAFGVFIFNSNAQDYKFDEFGEDKAMFTYRTIGGILDVFVFSGPTPELVIRQYQSIIGNPYLPPYWAFGFQLCRYGYDKLDNMKAAMFRTLNASIPIDVHYAICGDYISDKTLCMIAEQTDGRGKIYTHYDVHNLYGWSETIATLPAARSIENKRSVVISRSTFPTSGSFTGHWLGDNTADWRHLKYNIIGMLEFNLFGIPYIGADICGFFHNTTEQMCQRWMQLGSFNPFFRNHNGNDQDGIKFIEQDPGIFSPDVVASNRRAVEQRYTLIPYLYSLFFRVHISGGTVVRSMAHVFPTIPDCWPLDEQFLWGSSLLIAPVIKENHTTKSVYLPWTERWFNYYTGEEMKALNETTVAAPYDFLPLFLRGGSIIPHQQSAMNTVESRKKPLYLIVALDKNQQATGELFWDDGESIDTYNRGTYNHFNFVFKSNGLTIEPWTYKYPEMGDTIKLEDIKVFGMNIIPTRVLWNGQELKPAAQWTFNNATNILQMTGFALNVAKIHKFTFL